jgi:hypothetical protein
MKINEMTKRDMERFYQAVESKFDVVFVNANTPRGRMAAQKIHKTVNGILDNPLAKMLSIAPVNIDLRPMCIDKLIVLTFEPASQERTPLKQIEIVTHELSHHLSIENARNEKGATFFEWLMNYYTDACFRALEEGTAQQAEQELWYWLRGKQIRLNLESGYVLSSGDISLAAIEFDNHWGIIKKRRGMCLHSASKSVIEILKGLGVEPV